MIRFYKTGSNWLNPTTSKNLELRWLLPVEYYEFKIEIPVDMAIRSHRAKTPGADLNQGDIGKVAGKGIHA